MQIWAESGKSALPICNYSQILYQFLTFTQNLKRSRDRSQLRFFQFCGNAAHTITTFAQAEGALHFDSIGIILILLFSLVRYI
jgi:hypothetical protein